MDDVPRFEPRTQVAERISEHGGSLRAQARQYVQRACARPFPRNEKRRIGPLSSICEVCVILVSDRVHVVGIPGVAWTTTVDFRRARNSDGVQEVEVRLV